MEKKYLFAIIIFCIFVLLISIIKLKLYFAINFLLRCCIGIIAIYSFNKFILESLGNPIKIGINEFTVPFMGIFGVAGIIFILAIYGYFYK